MTFRWMNYFYSPARKLQEKDSNILWNGIDADDWKTSEKEKYLWSTTSIDSYLWKYFSNQHSSCSQMNVGQKSYLGETIFEDEDHWEFFWHLSIVLRSLSNYPLLHKMCIHGYDEYLSLFSRNLPTLKSQRDDDGRSFHQTVLEYCPNRIQHFIVSWRLAIQSRVSYHSSLLVVVRSRPWIHPMSFCWSILSVFL